MSVYDVRMEADARERADALAEQWVDAFMVLCWKPPTDREQFPAYLAWLRERIAALDAIEAEEAEVRGLL